MNSKASKEIRHSQVAFVLAKLRVQGVDCLLLNAHHKWGDWSLVGGHVEQWEKDDWRSAAAREVSEEMAPLRCGEEVDVESLRLPDSEWGPVESRSAEGKLTTYRARWYVLRFRTDPRESLSKLPAREFCLVPLDELPKWERLSSVVRRAAELLPGGWPSLPLSWDEDLAEAPGFAAARDSVTPGQISAR